MKITKEKLAILCEKIDKLFLEQQNNICHRSSEEWFGKNYWGLTIPRCSEEDFILWWNKNKNIPYNSYFYELACYVWDTESSQYD